MYISDVVNMLSDTQLFVILYLLFCSCLLVGWYLLSNFLVWRVDREKLKWESVRNGSGFSGGCRKFFSLLFLEGFYHV